MPLTAVREADGRLRLWPEVPWDLRDAHPGSLQAALIDALAEERLNKLITGLNFGRGAELKAWTCLVCEHEVEQHDFESTGCLDCDCLGYVHPRGIRGGAATAWAMTNGGRTSVLNGTFDFDTDSQKMALFLSTSNIGAASTTYAGVTNEHANANGYTTTGIAITLTLSGTTTVTVDISTDPVWTAAGGSIVARFAVIYEVSGNVMFYCTLDSTPADVTATDGNTLTVAAHASGITQLA